MPSPAPVREVGVVFKTHLDIGFTDFADRIVRRYIEGYIPAALDLARRTRDSADRFVWTTGSWLAYRYLEDAPPAARRAMEEAIAAGDFHWHALPFTTHTEFMDADLFRLGLSYSKILDKRFGRKTRGAKMTDVPGHTIAMLPLLAEAGVRFLHLGVNPASPVPSVPPAFVWRRGDAEIVVVYESDYGGVTPLPGGSALCVNLTGDNLGPQNPGQVGAVYERLRAAYPGARIRPGGLDLVVPGLWKNRSALPVVTSEIGDTWIHGVGTDPGKAAGFRALSRLRRRWLREKRLTIADATDLSLGEQLLLVAEHTWGMDLKTHRLDWKNYAPAAFARARFGKNFRKVEASWTEQRRYLRRAVVALPADLRTEAATELRAVRVKRPTRAGWSAAPLAAPFTLGALTLSLDPATGGIHRLVRDGETRSLASATRQLARLVRQTYSNAEYDLFYRAYNLGEADWSRKDFTKPGLPATAQAGRQTVTLSRLELHADGHRARATLCFPGATRRDGAPPSVTLELTAPANTSGKLALALTWRDKPAVRLPEAYWLEFAPRLAAGERWRFRKLGEWIDPADVVAGGNRWLHAIEDEARAGDVSITTLDAPLVAPERGRLLEFPKKGPRTDAGLAFNLFNNKWGTNFPMWSEGSARFRFVLKFDRKN